jgi:hypothetical protein
MEKILKSRLLTCILVFVLASSIFVFAGDVIVQNGDLKADDDVQAGDWLYGTYLYTWYNAYVSCDLYVYYGADISWDLDVGGKIYSNGGYDPPYVLYDQRTRQEIVDMIGREVPPEKRDGAVLLFNKDTKRFETYVPSEGKFYDLQGKLLDTMPVIEAAKEYKTVYYLDSLTGEVKARQKVVQDRYGIIKGFELDSQTGHFINRATGEIVSQETAVEIVNPGF